MTRIYLSRDAIETGERGGAMELDAETSKKLLKVLRLSPGEMFVGFDGFGREWDCALLPPDEENPKSKIARAALIAEREEATPRRLHLSVAQAIPKGDKMDWVLQKGTELGIAEFWPFVAARSVPEYDDDRALARAERWRKIAATAAAQCGRADVPIVHAISEFSTVVDYGTTNSRCFFLDELGETGALRASLEKEALEGDEETPARAMIIVGPEGGWTERERDWATRYGAEAVGLGRLVLRTETAALVAATVLQWEAGELD
ncbi:MAG TPA: RsmE family RNA methyltransferase [Abditibacteriaceae bacterium]|jgi:16S rRNA (uracil1498-N3)-methyltransferase